MYILRNIRWQVILTFAWRHLLIFTLWNTLVYYAFHFLEHAGINLHLPFQPISTIGIAVAFYIGFKNNASYDRFWEARKIWGGIVNYSRTWASQVLYFVTNHHATDKLDDAALYKIHRELIYRHLAYINALRLNLRKPSATNAVEQNSRTRRKYSQKMPGDQHWLSDVTPFLDDSEYLDYCKAKNPPTQINRVQAKQLRKYGEDMGLIDDFRHMEMMRVLEEFYNLQGKAERIKHTPFPRQYGFFSKLFTWIFILLLPFGLIGEFAKMGHDFQVLVIPFCVLISWIFMTMELVGDNSEDPFENYINDVPMTALCNTIEIDLRQMLGETEFPPKTEAVDGILL